MNAKQESVPAGTLDTLRALLEVIEHARESGRIRYERGSFYDKAVKAGHAIIKKSGAA